MLPWQNILSNRQIAADVEEKRANQGEVLRWGISPIYLSSSNKWKPCHRAINSRLHNLRMALECTFDFREIVTNYGLKRGTVWKFISILRLISQFSLKLYIQFWKCFHNMILGRLGKGFGLRCFSAFKFPDRVKNFTKIQVHVGDFSPYHYH